MLNGFLPVSKEDMNLLGWDDYDFLVITADAYVDHPSFAAAIISRVLENAGYRVAVLAQPDWHSAEQIKKMGRPRLGVFISGGNIDSMVNRYTAAKKPRSEDLYSPGGKVGSRPDRPTIVYSGRVREAFHDIPIIIGGLEASLRRFAHYDFWDNKVRRSIIFDSKADLISFGMGEHQTVDIASALKRGKNIKQITNIKGTAFVCSSAPKNAVVLPSFEKVRDDKNAYAVAAKIQHDEQDPIRGNVLCQQHGDKFLVQNVPSMPLSTAELDAVYSLPYTRTYHPSYQKDGGVPALSEVSFSLTSSRGCFGNCNFCAIAFHQGRIVQSRSHQSLLKEAEMLTQNPDFKGYIHDVGGPTANFRFPACDKQLKSGTCKDRQCLSPTPCKNLKADHRDYIELLGKLRKIKGVKKVFIRSGIRYDYLIYDKSDKFMNDLCEHHISGQLKVAPEHISPRVLSYMGKPNLKVYEKFVDNFHETNKKIGKEQYLVPYLISGHPGATLDDAIDLALYLKKHKLHPEQVQAFYPTPGTISTAMYYTGIDPLTMKKVYVPETTAEKNMHRALLQYYKPENYELVKSTLIKAGRQNLIGFSDSCLIKPTKEKNYVSNNTQRKNSFSKNKRPTQKRGRGSQSKGNFPRSRSNNRGR